MTAQVSRCGTPGEEVPALEPSLGCESPFVPMKRICLSAAWPTVLSLIVTNGGCLGKAHEQAERVIPHQSVFPAMALWGQRLLDPEMAFLLPSIFFPIDLLT